MEKYGLTSNFASCPTHGRTTMVEIKAGSFKCLHCDYTFIQKLEFIDGVIQYTGMAEFSIYATPVDLFGSKKGVLKYKTKNIRTKKKKK